MAGAGFGIDATRCGPTLDPADCRRGPNIEKPRRLTCALARLHDRQYPDPKVLGVSLRHRRPPLCRREHTNLICEPKGIPCNFSDSHQTESALVSCFCSCEGGPNEAAGVDRWRIAGGLVRGASVAIDRLGRRSFRED